MIARERLLLTADKARLVRDGDPEGKTLYCTPGTEIPESAVKLFGLVDGRLGDGTAALEPEPQDGDTKEKAPGQDKEKAPDGDKGAGGGTKGAAGSAADAPAGDDLTKVKFVGTVVAQGMAKAGITTFAQIAAIDAASPPAIDGTGARTNWAGIVESAKEIVAAAAAVTEQGNGTASGDGGTGAGSTDQTAT